jgi:hypothetical protein
MTTLLCFLRSDGKYEEKWKRATKRAMSHIPLIDDILSALKGKKWNKCSTIISNIADILLLTTGRQAQRAFFPILIVPEAFTILRGSRKFYSENAIERFNVSGRGAFLCYKEIMKMDNITLTGDFTQQEASQILYHCIFGTYKEDLGVLAQITNCSTWFTREDFGRKFQGVGASKKEISFKPIQQTLYSKLSSANQTGLLSSSYLQSSSIPVFSGQRQTTFSNEFFDSTGKRLGSSLGGKTIEQLQVATKTLLNEIIENIKGKGCKIDMGTVKWREVASLTEDEDGAETNAIVTTTGKFFLGRSNLILVKMLLLFFLLLPICNRLYNINCKYDKIIIDIFLAKKM